MRVLHIASFTGNVGDNASHSGFYNVLSSISSAYEVDSVEIRRFYRQYSGGDALCFDDRFIGYANKYDLVVFGGGGFLDYWVPGSSTGTTLDINQDLVRKISVPTLLVSMGCFPHREVPEGNVHRFRLFLDALLENPMVRIAVRNDGSRESIERDIGGKYVAEIPEILDNGFFYGKSKEAWFPSGRQYVALNVADDQIRMLSHRRGPIDEDAYYRQLGELVRAVVLHLGYDVVLVPHIYGDLRAIVRLFEELDDHIVRRHVSVAPSVQGEQGADLIFSIYRRASAVVATRFHANVCSIAMGKPVIGLAVLDRVEYLYRSLGIADSCVDPIAGFADDVLHRLSVPQAKQGSLVSAQRATKETYTRFLRELGLL